MVGPRSASPAGAWGPPPSAARARDQGLRLFSVGPVPQMQAAQAPTATYTGLREQTGAPHRRGPRDPRVAVVRLCGHRPGLPLAGNCGQPAVRRNKWARCRCRTSLLRSAPTAPGRGLKVQEEWLAGSVLDAEATTANSCAVPGPAVTVSPPRSNHPVGGSEVLALRPGRHTHARASLSAVVATRTAGSWASPRPPFSKKAVRMR